MKNYLDEKKCEMKNESIYDRKNLANKAPKYCFQFEKISANRG